MQTQLSKLQKMFFQFSESVNAIKIDLSFSDSKQYIPTNNKKCSRRRNSRSKLLTQNTRAQNERYIKNLSSQALSNEEVRLLSRGLKFISTPPVPSSNKFLLKDFDNFSRTMRLKYMFADKRKTSAHPFHVKSTLQPQNYITGVKFTLYISPTGRNHAVNYWRKILLINKTDWDKLRR